MSLDVTLATFVPFVPVRAFAPVEHITHIAPGLFDEDVEARVTWQHPIYPGWYECGFVKCADLAPFLFPEEGT